MIEIRWEVNDGKFRPAIDAPVKGRIYPVADKIAHSYVLQKMASYVNAKDKPVAPKSKPETKIEEK